MLADADAAALPDVQADVLAVQADVWDTCPGLPRTFLTIPEQKSQENSGHPGMSC